MTYEELWGKFIELNPNCADKDYSVYNYDEDDVKAILNGEKKSETSLYDSFVGAGEPLPVKGDVAIILDADDNAVCVIEDKMVELKPISSAKNKKELEEAAKDEGINLTDESIVVVESFEVIYK